MERNISLECRGHRWQRAVERSSCMCWWTRRTWICQSMGRGRSKRQTVPKFCATRWSAKFNTLSALLTKYDSVPLTLVEISSSSSGDAKSNAPAYSSLLQDSHCIVAYTVSQFVLSLLAQVTNSLQAKSCNLGDAYQSVTLAKECIKSARGEESWQKVWSQISRIADSINVTLLKPRTKTVQRHQANAAHNDQPSDYYRINVLYPFIDHVVDELKTRIFQSSTKAWLPFKTCSLCTCLS